MPKNVRISLANKCHLLFGAAVVLILAVALAVVWMRMQSLVRLGQEETARKLAEAWIAGRIELGVGMRTVDEPLTLRHGDPSLTITLIRKDEFDWVAHRDPFLAKAIDRFETSSSEHEIFQEALDNHGQPYYRYARAIRKADLVRLKAGASASLAPEVETLGLANPVQMVLLLQLRANQAQMQLAVNRIYIIAAGLIAGLLAISVFWFITMRLILSPVRVLRNTAQKISEGDLNTRADINTGDEFEQLSDSFNRMVESLKQSQDKLRDVNKGLDLRLVELSKVNINLHEANQVKNEFLANVSHELRTPLNSIIGFAEVLQETLKDRTGPVDEKRKRYASNIILASRRLLDLINDLLDLGKIEAGRMELRLSPMSVVDTMEGLITLIRPQAEKRGVHVDLSVEPNIPLVHTDAGKFQQVIFNFLSNAVKFAPDNGQVTITARLQTPAPGISGGSAGATGSSEGPGSGAAGSGGEGVVPRLSVSVADNGPGIPRAMHDKIFEKFTQLDPAVTRAHGGSGLGLAISRELARLLRGQIDVDSDPGKGATFTLTIPLKLEEPSAPLMPAPSPVPPVSPPLPAPAATSGDHS